MINRIQRLSLLTSLLLCCACSSNRQETEQEAKSQEEASAVRQSFAAYKEAVLNDKGQEALAVITRNSRQYYGQMKQLALKAPEAEVRQLSTGNKMMVLFIRHRIPLNSLQGMTSENLFVHTVNQGWVGKSGVIKIDIGKVEISGKHAVAEIVHSGQPTPLRYRFAKEEDKWKMDLSSAMTMAEQSFKQMIKEEDMDEDEFIFTVIELASGKKVPEKIWQPLQP
jgi:hypothetical protein